MGGNDEKSGAGKMKIHAGCGPIYIDGFYNIDKRTDVKTDFCGSLFDVETVEADFIWSCHMLEHLEYPMGVVDCLALFYKWLKPGGGLRLALPDLELVANYYTQKKKNLYNIFGTTTDKHYFKKQSAAERFMFFMRGWEHTIIFDFDLIKELLEDAGFKNIKKKEFNMSDFGKWEHDRYPI
jgi:predicted SAM-dependent methyltransferase